jgi:sugar phosphate isomerase/epimerase
MHLSIGSYSFHRLLEAKKQDMFGYIADCKRLGATQLDPWNAHLALLRQRDAEIAARADLSAPPLDHADIFYIEQVREAALQAGLPFGCLAVDGAHIYEPTPTARRANRSLAYRWLAAAHRLGAAQVRIDAGGTPGLDDEMFAVIVDGYKDLLDLATSLGIELVIENHWGCSQVPENLARLFATLPGLGLLFDTNNWTPGRQLEGWQLCARYARSTHFKSFGFDKTGRDPSVDLEQAIAILLKAGYDGCWGVESTPEDGDEYGAVEKTIALIRRTLAAAGHT